MSHSIKKLEWFSWNIFKFSQIERQSKLNIEFWQVFMGFGWLQYFHRDSFWAFNGLDQVFSGVIRFLVKIWFYNINSPNRIYMPLPRPQWHLFFLSPFHIFATGSAMTAYIFNLDELYIQCLSANIGWTIPWSDNENLLHVSRIWSSLRIPFSSLFPARF